MSTSAGSSMVDLVGTVEVLHRYVEEAACDEVFRAVRKGERNRNWTLSLLVEFWTAVVLRAPASLTQAFAEASGGNPGYPAVRGTRQGFFERCKTLSPAFFSALFERFAALVSENEPARFASAEADVIARFGRVFLIDGSTLDRVARRLKVLRSDRRIPLGGSIVAAYDVGLGAPTAVEFDRAPQGREMPCAREVLDRLPKGSLCVGDRLYGVPAFFAALSDRGLFGLSRRNRVAGMEKIRRLSVEEKGGERIEDWVVSVGIDARTSTQTLRFIRWTRGGRSREVLTNVLDPALLSAPDALRFYDRRWSIERMFYDLKEVLNLHRFYAANSNAVAMQVYASAMVYVAMRVAQARIAVKARVEPEAISPARLFPRVAAASSNLATAELVFDATCRANPEVRLQKPDWHTLPFANAKISDLLVERRNAGRRRRPRCRAAERHRPLPRPPGRPPR